ncbi:MAG: PepSY domain-containing protein [Parahaliea sp.]
MKNFSKKLTSALIGTGLSATVVSFPAFAVSNATEAMNTFVADGYIAIYDLELRHGYWTAEATTANGTRVELLLNAGGELSEVGNPNTSDNIASAREVVEHLRSLGYTAIHEVELDDGFWEAEARKPSGEKVELTVHPVTLEIVSEVSDGNNGYNENGNTNTANPVLNAQQIRSVLLSSGYSNIRDLEFDDGYWEAEARNNAGINVDLKIDPRTGAVIRESLDD